MSDTTPPEIEADHIRLRLLAGFKHVAVIAGNSRKLEQIRKLFLTSNQADDPRVNFYSPEAFTAKLREWAAADSAGGATEKKKLGKNKSIFSVAARRTPEEWQEYQKGLLKKLAERMKPK